MQFVDIQGKLREIDITQKGLKRASFKEKFFDGSSVKMAPIEESDLLLKPIKKTFFILPWNKKGARVLCDIFKPNKNMEEHELSPRFILKTQLKKAEEIIEELKKDKTIKKALGKAFDVYIKLKEEELKEFKKQNPKWDLFEITDWEIERYLQF